MKVISGHQASSLLTAHIICKYPPASCCRQF